MCQVRLKLTEWFCTSCKFILANWLSIVNLFKERMVYLNLTHLNPPKLGWRYLCQWFDVQKCSNVAIWLLFKRGMPLNFFQWMIYCAIFNWNWFPDFTEESKNKKSLQKDKQWKNVSRETLFDPIELKRPSYHGYFEFHLLVSLHNDHRILSQQPNAV